MKQITIYDLLPLLKKGWVAMDSSGEWWWFEFEPHKTIKDQWLMNALGLLGSLSNMFNIEPFDGSWKDSLIKVEHKEEE